jgi:Tol biopolymer transport system component
MNKIIPFIVASLSLVGCATTQKAVVETIDNAPGITGNAKELIRVTNDPIPEFKPRISPDGKKMIFYTRDDNKQGFQKWGIVYIKLGEPGRIPLVGEFISDASWLSDSKGFLFQYLQPSKPVICRGNIDGNSGISYLSPSGMGDFDGAAQISVDGKKVLFHTSIGGIFQICLMDITGNNFTLLTKGSNPFWNPNGQGFIYENLVGKNSHLFYYDLKSGQSTQLTSGDQNNYSPSINPKGDKIAFSSTRANSRHIFTANLMGGEITQITQGNTIDDFPVFNSDNTIYFCSNAGGTIKKKVTTTTANYNARMNAMFRETLKNNPTTQTIYQTYNIELGDYSDIWSVQVK